MIFKKGMKWNAFIFTKQKWNWKQLFNSTENESSKSYERDLRVHFQSITYFTINIEMQKVWWSVNGTVFIWFWSSESIKMKFNFDLVKAKSFLQAWVMKLIIPMSTPCCFKNFVTIIQQRSWGRLAQRESCSLCIIVSSGDLSSISQQYTKSFCMR